ncbi:MAG: type II toxin-antitoxin system RelE/ParE family toxin [Proteobacteria bacterium]|nr:type II toxin-antitoxin system RelE/ParE family toxin [Pseudomonadota bacterium]
MTGYRLSPEARRDILDITDYVAADNVDAALRLRDRLFAAFDRLARRPGLGHVRDDLIARTAGVRFWPVGVYLVIYRPLEATIGIVRVLSGYRDLAAILGRT